jgi:hypothetical protein
MCDYLVLDVFPHYSRHLIAIQLCYSICDFEAFIFYIVRYYCKLKQRHITDKQITDISSSRSSVVAAVSQTVFAAVQLRLV